jgi:GNAT superfamily N-acetyltransferase
VKFAVKPTWIAKAKCQPVDGRLYADRLCAFNDAYPDDFIPLESQHLERGQWFTIEIEGKLIAFAGTVPFVPFPDVAYFKRVAVLPEYRGYGLQAKLMDAAENAAALAGYRRMVSTTDIVNVHSSNNFIKRGWRLTNPEKPWEPTSLYWYKDL